MTFNASQINLSGKSWRFNWLRHFLLALFYWIFVFACFCYCFYSHKTYCDALLFIYAWQTTFASHWVISERSYWAPLKILSLMSVKSLKIIFRKFFWILTTPNFFLEVSVNVSTNRIPFRYSADKINLITGFIYLLVWKLQWHEIS